MEDKQRSQDQSAVVIALGSIVVVLICLGVGGLLLLITLGFGAFAFAAPSPSEGPTPIVDFPFPTTMEPAVPQEPDQDLPTPVPFSPETEAILEALATTEVPPRDRYDLAIRFRGVDPDLPREIQLQEYRVGDIEKFFVSNSDIDEMVTVEGELLYIAGADYKVYAWGERGVQIDRQALREEIDRFAIETVPTALGYFGGENFPGGEPVQFHIFNTEQMGAGVAGYYFSPSEYPREVVETSNEKSMFFINHSNTPPTSRSYGAVLAHEFQHLIHWHVDQNEETWMNEGMSELSAQLNGYGASSFVSSFTSNPGIQLTTWPEVESSLPHYGAGYLFATYFLQRFGNTITQELIASPLNGMDGVEEALVTSGQGMSADDVFADWVVANYIDEPDLGPGWYGYKTVDIPPVTVTDTLTDSDYAGYSHEGTIRQYGTDYFELAAPGSVAVTFDGVETVALIPAPTQNTDRDPATDDSFVWWSNRGDDSDVTLTRAFDLTGVSEAVLTYDVWFWIEDLWDYAYLTVSTDGGATWEILSTPYTTLENPHGNAYGPGYTGQSSRFSNEAGGWLSEEIDLSAYAGQEILVRFEMVTDDAVNQPGLAIDNVRLDAVGFTDDVEEGVGEWEARGFIRHNNLLPQRFLVQIVRLGGNGDIQVERFALNDLNLGSIDFTLEGGPAIVTISGLTRHTTEPADYTLRVVSTVGF